MQNSETVTRKYRTSGPTVRTVEHGQYTRVYTRDSEGRLLTSPACWEKSLAEGPEGPRLQLDPFLTCSRGASILKWVRLEFRLIMHEMNRVTQKF